MSPAALKAALEAAGLSATDAEFDAALDAPAAATALADEAGRGRAAPFGVEAARDDAKVSLGSAATLGVGRDVGPIGGSG